MGDTCKLRETNGTPNSPCSEGDCIYWRVVSHVGVAEQSQHCAIQHFELLGGDDALADWLLSVKERIERPVDA